LALDLLEKTPYLKALSNPYAIAGALWQTATLIIIQPALLTQDHMRDFFCLSLATHSSVSHYPTYLAHQW
jgi:hypothetical protein